MCYLSTYVFLIQQTGLNQGTGMLGNGLKIPTELSSDFFDRDPLSGCHCPQDSYSPMIGRSLEIPLQLLGSLHI